MNLLENAKFILGHTWAAGGAALFFAAGAACGIPVLRRRIRFFLLMGESFVKILRQILEKRRATVLLGLFIFGWNGTVIFISMLTGLIPWLPIVMVFIIGLNVMVATLLGQENMRREAIIVRPPSISARICSVITFLLELPCLWYSIGMGLMMRTNLARIIHGEGIEDIRSRVLAYLTVILPLLLISALAEAHAVNESLGRKEASEKEDTE